MTSPKLFGVDRTQRPRQATNSGCIAFPLAPRPNSPALISYACGRVHGDLKQVGYVMQGRENAGEHFFM